MRNPTLRCQEILTGQKRRRTTGPPEDLSPQSIPAQKKRRTWQKPREKRVFWGSYERGPEQGCQNSTGCPAKI